MQPMQELLPHRRGTILEQSVPRGLYAMGNTHAATILRSCSPWRGPILEQCESLYPVKGTPCWKLEKVLGEGGVRDDD